MPRRSIETERFGLGPGKCHVLASPDSYSELPPALRRLVPRAMLEVWRGFPRSFAAMAERAEGRGFALWLESFFDCLITGESFVARFDPATLGR